MCEADRDATDEQRDCGSPQDGRPWILTREIGALSNLGDYQRGEDCEYLRYAVFLLWNSDRGMNNRWHDEGAVGSLNTCT